MRPNLSRSIDFTDPNAALDELQYLTVKHGIAHCIVHPWEVRLRHKYRIVRSDQLRSMDRVVAKLTPPNIRSTNNGNHGHVPDHDDQGVINETRVAS